MIVFGLAAKDFLWGLFPATGFAIGWWLDLKESERMTRYRDKSSLYGRQLAPGEPPSWP